MKKILKQSKSKMGVFRWLIFTIMSLGMSLSVQAAQYLASNMQVVLGTATGAVGDLSLESEGKVVRLDDDANRDLRLKFNFPAPALSSQIELVMNIQQQVAIDQIKFEVLSGTSWVRLGVVTGSTSYQKVAYGFTVTSGMIKTGGRMYIRLNTRLSANNFVNLDQFILRDKAVAQQPPVIASFSANPSTITAGQNSVLNFSISDATSAVINPGNINVSGLSSYQVSPSATTSYTLTASNSGGSVSSSVNVTVNPVSGGVTIPAGTKWYWQLQGNINMNLSPKVYDIDLYDTSASTIATLKQSGHIVICYFSAGTYEDWRSDAGQFPSSALGNNVDGWPGEKWLDVRNTTVRNIMSNRMDLAKSKGCDGLEPDNVDGYSNGSGFPLTKQNQIDFNKYLATQAHAKGLIIALKNSTDLVTALVSSFDFAVVEECFKYNECEAYSPFIAQNKAVLNAEYTNYSANTCNKAATLKFSTAFFNLDLNGNKFQPCP